MAGPVLAQRGFGMLSRALELERSKRYEEAAREYGRILEINITNLPAMLGLERVLTPLGRLDELVPVLDSALVREPLNRQIRTAKLRTWGNLSRLDSLRAAAREWIRIDPGSPEPYRQWSFALTRAGRVAEALAVLERGYGELETPRLAAEIAHVNVILGRWEEAAQAWILAAGGSSRMTAPAVLNLARAPVDRRRGVLDVLQATERKSPARILAAQLLVAWNKPVEAWAVLDNALPEDRSEASAVLRQFLQRAKLIRTKDGARVRGFAYERLAGIARGPQAERARLDAAREFAAAGDRKSAERMLEKIAHDPEVRRQDQVGAISTLIDVMARSGRAEEAEKRFREWSERLTAGDRNELRRTVAWAWIRKAELDRAENLLAGDSTIEGFAVRAWLALFRGHLAVAGGLFRQAGPFAGTREEATRRTEMVALIQNVPADTLNELGRGLLYLAQGDSSRAIERLLEAAERVRTGAGRGEILLLAGKISAPSGKDERTEEILKHAIDADSAGPAAPRAALELARHLVTRGKLAEAAPLLESLILNYPQSAVLPQARRLLQRARGMVPKS